MTAFRAALLDLDGTLLDSIPDAELHVIDPGRAAIGFEIDACLRSESGHVGCANEARRRAAG